MKEIEGKFFLIDGIEKPIEEFDENIIINGKTIYEVIRVMKGKPLFYNMHIERFHNSANLSGIKIFISDDELKNQMINLISINNIDWGNVKIALKNDSLSIFKIKHKYPDKNDYDKGVSTVLFIGERKDPNIKLIDTEFRARANEKIKAKGVYEAILVDNNGYITEGSRSNIFMVKEEKLITSPSSSVLPGITRTIIIAAAKKLGLTVIEEKISYKEIDKVDGLFISGTSTKVLPVSKVDEIYLGSTSNSIIGQLMKEYDKLAQEDINSFSL